MDKLKQEQERVDNLICTMIKLYPLSLSYAFKRASELTGKSKGYVCNRYYSKIRHERQLFCIKTDEVEIWNKKRMSKSDMENAETF